MDSKDYLPVGVMVFVLIVVLAGEVITFTNSHDDYHTSISVVGDEVSFSIESSNAHEYDVISLENPLAELVSVSIYYDTSYCSVMGNGKSSIGSRELNQAYYVEQMEPTLRVRGVSNVDIVDADGLKTLMSDNDNAKGRSVVILSGALPDTVYNGKSDSLILDWIDSGGRLYWVGNVLGKYISYKDSYEIVDGTSLFLGSDCITSEEHRAMEAIKDNGYRDYICLRNNDTTYSVNTALLPSDVKYQCVGYTDGERASITFVEHGAGMICIMGGEYSMHQRVDLAEVIAANIGPETRIVDHVSGTVMGSVERNIAKADAVFILLGGFYPVYASYYEVV